MASKLALRDIQIGKKQAWHGDTTITKETIKADCLGYENEFKPLFLETENGFERFQSSGDGLIDNSKGHHGLEKADFAFNWGTIISSDDSLPAGNGRPVNLETYSLRNARQDFEIVLEAISGTGHEVISAGTTNNRSRHFMSIALEKRFFFIEGREFENYLNTIGSVDCSTPFVNILSGFCTVCDNTLQANVMIAKLREKQAIENGEITKGFNGCSVIKHSKNMEAEIKLLRKNLELAIGAAGEFEQALKSLEGETIETDCARELFAGFIGGNSARLSTRSENMVESLFYLFANGRGNDGKTKLDALSAVTEFYTRGDSRVDSKKSAFSRWQSSEFGSYADRKKEFSGIIADENETRKTIAKGKSLLAVN